MTQRIFAAAVVLAVVIGSPAFALGELTHGIINREAALGSSSFDEYMRNALGFRAGNTTLLRSGVELRQINQWIAEGGEREDDAFRFLFHFHDPLQPVDRSGLGLGPARFASSLNWMHDPAQFWSWPSARILYYNALTEVDPARRDALWADLFRAVGQIMHLVVDASVPEHTRNDIHPLGAMKLENSYERWVAEQHGGGGASEAAFVAKYLALPVGFLHEGRAAPPTLIDADRYDGSNPRVTVGADSRAPVSAGLAEISNANFFSEDTLRGQYPSPTDAGLIAINLATPHGKVRRYFSRPTGQGLLPANPLKAECASDAMSLRGVPGGRAPYPCVDPLVWNQVAMHMLPRAVGYARGVLDYFFRGSLAVTDVTWDASGVRMDVWNTSDEEMEGVFEIWARHAPDSPRERRTKLATLGSGERIRLAPGDLYTFDRIAIPSDARATARHVLVFRGRLGTEDGAVAAQVFTVPHVDIRQTTYAATTEFFCAAPVGFSTAPAANTTVTIRNDAHSCAWRIVAHHVTGTLATNMPVDPATTHPEPILAKIEARWTGDANPVPLVVDGRSVGRTWLRQGSEPDPTTFEIHDPTVRVWTRPLALVVTYTSGRQAVFRMVRIISAGVTHEKMMLLDNRTPPGTVLVASRRSATAFLSLDLALQFETVAHSGFTAPLSGATNREFGSSSIGEGTVAERQIFLQMEVDDFQTFSALAAAAQTAYDSIELKSPHPDGPTYGWDAEVRRIYQPMEREFLRAFVTTAPVPFTVRLTGAGLAGTQ